MSTTLWAHRPLPPAAAGASGAWEWELRRIADVTAARGDLREITVGGGIPDDEAHALLLSFEELASNGLRHGRSPVRVRVAATAAGWLIDASDRAVDRPPVPAIGRDAVDGGLGLYLVARLAVAHGWTVHGSRKHVWAVVERSQTRRRHGWATGAEAESA
jgi:anti-sigma regulatory factor (Ser/Thr protein kinase)